MPNIKFLQGKLASLPSKITEGQVYFAYEDVKDGNNVVGYKGSIYIDKDSSTRVKMTANADVAATANKALNDYDGKDIRRYLVSAEQSVGSDKSRTFTFKTGSNNITNLTIPIAGNVDSGLVTNLNQTLYGFKRIALRARPCAIVGSDTANTSGWYKVADSTMSNYGNTDIIYLVQENYGKNGGGLLHVQMRSDNTSIQTFGIKWLVRQEGLSSDTIRVVINGMKWTMYAYRGISQYGRLSFTEISHNNISGDAPSYTVNYYNSTTKETTEPDGKITSSDGGLVAAANKAYVDSSGQNIVNTYIKALAFTDYGTNLEPTLGSGIKGAKIALPVAGTGSAGIVTTGTQTFAGKKTFKSLEVNNSGGFNYSAIESATGDSSRPIWFARADGNGVPCYNVNFTYNPATKTLNAEKINGTAAKATADGGNRVIADTYAKYNGFSFVAGADNVTMKSTAGSGTVNNSAGVIPAASASAAGVVTTGAQSFKGNKTFTEGLICSGAGGFQYSGIETDKSNDVARSVWFNHKSNSGTPVIDGQLLYNPAKKTLYSTNFEGLASKATADSSGNSIVATYIKSLSTNGTTTITATKGNGSQSTITLTQYEGNLNWGGRNFSGSFGPVDAARIPELGADRFAYIQNANAITVEYSRDGGATWTSYGASDESKRGLFTLKGSTFLIGKADANNKATANTNKYQLRVTVDTDAAQIYTEINKFAFYISTNGSSNCTCDIDASLENTPTTFVNFAKDVSISGWSGWNIINISKFATYGNTKTSQYGLIRFTFKANGGNTNYNGLQIGKIKAFGGMGWVTPSTMAQTGHLYEVNTYLSATFPNAVNANTFLANTCSSITNWNDATKSGLYMGNGAANGPTTAWYMGQVFAHNSNYVIQVVYQFTASTDATQIPKYIRTKENGTWGKWTDVTVQVKVPVAAKFTDQYVLQNVADNSYTNWRPIILGNSSSGTEGFTPTANTNSVLTHAGLSYQPSTGIVKATIFKGRLQGNADTATNATNASIATKANQDGSGNSIIATYVKHNGLSFTSNESSLTVTASTPSGAKTTYTIPVAGNKTTGVITAGNQDIYGNKNFYGDIMVQANIIGKTIDNHNSTQLVIFPQVPYSVLDSTHDTKTYLKALVKWLCQKYPNKNNVTFVGTSNPNSVMKTTIHIYSTSTVDSNGYPKYATGNAYELGGAQYNFGFNNYEYYYFADLNELSKFASSDKIGGSATSAVKLDSSAGSATQPIYFSEGKPVATTYSLSATVYGAKSNSGKLAYYSSETSINYTNTISYINNVKNSKNALLNGLRIFGNTYGNDGAATISGAAGVLNWGDGGPQIRFSTGADGTSGLQEGALIYTDHDSAGEGASFHFVSNQSQWQVVSKRYVARAGLTVGQDNYNSSANLYVNGSTKFNGIVYFASGTTYYVNNSGTANLNDTTVNGILTVKTDSKLITHGNEFNFVPTLTSDMTVNFNYRQTGGNNTNNYKIAAYSFRDGAGGILATITNNLFSGSSKAVYLPRVATNANNSASLNTVKFEEFTSGDNYNLPTNSWYHIMTSQGDDKLYATQLALGMSTQNIAYRIRNGNETTWNNWLTVLTSSNYNNYAPTKTGTGASGTWGINITGNAASASKLTTNAGGDDKPVYFENGVPKACTKSMYVHPESTVATGTYKSVTVDKYGHVTAGTNPTTLAGYGITDAAAKNHTHNYAGSASAGGAANSALQLTNARTISLGGLSSGSVSFNGTSNVTINNWGYGNYKYVTTNSTDAPYYRIATTSTTASYVDCSMVFVIDSGYENGGFGIVKVVLRTDAISAANNTHGQVTWLARQGFSANQLILKVTTQANGTQYADLYFKATGLYNACNVVVLEMGSRGSSGQAWTMTNPSSESARASMNIRTYTNEYVGYDAGNVNYSALAYQATRLQTARNINGTSFNGTADIVTAKWGNGRAFQIKDSALTYASDSVTVDGSAGVVLKMPAHGKFVSGLDIGNGTSAGSTINFYPASTSTIGCKIVAYSDRIEFVF